jgi:hypothetical protein
MTSSLPSLSSSSWAVGTSKIASVAPPMETSANSAIPEISKLRTGPRAATRIMSPTPNPSFSAVARSIAIWLRPTGQLPVTSWSGLKRWSAFGSTLNASLGLGPPPIVLPSRPTSPASSSIEPVAEATSGSRSTRVRTSAGNDVAPESPSSDAKATLPVITASVFSYERWVIVSKPFLIVSVRMNVPLTIATPRTIARAVISERSLRPASPLSATRFIGPTPRPAP